MGYTWQYYDLVLFGIAVSMVIGVMVGYLTALPLFATVPSAGLIAIGIIGHGLFVNGPVDSPEDLSDKVNTLN
ncbi:MAG: hypothetical protein SV377_02220 [Halobacteria archaeon]|nr:hypothetical protein [Halobacteria archaeon]